MSEETTNPTTPTPAETSPSPETVPDKTGKSGDSEPTFTQAQVDAIIKKRFQENEEAVRKGFLEGLGAESLDDVKALLEEHRKRKESEMSEVEKLNAKLAEEQANREKVQKELETLRLRGIADRRDAMVKELANDAGAVDVEDVLLNVRKDEGALRALVADDGTPDKDAIQKAIDAVKTAKPHLFSANVPGVPSSKTGRPIQPDKAALDAAKKAYRERLRRG